MQVVTHLPALQNLELECISEAPLSGLCVQQLTHLSIMKFSGTLTPATAPHFTRLTALGSLHLSAACQGAAKSVFSVALLEGMCQLQDLCLTGLRLLGAAEQQPARTPLTDWLCRANSAQRVRAAARPLPNFSPLLASKQLQTLQLVSCTLDRADRYSSVSGCSSPWQQVFCPRQPQHELWELMVEGVVPSLRPADVQCLVQACPGLSCLSLTRSLQQAEGDWQPLNPTRLEALPPGPHAWDNDLQAASLTALTALASLTELRCCEPDGPACEALAQLTQLGELTVNDPWRITRAGFRALTALTCLTQLAFKPMGEHPAGMMPLGFKATEAAWEVQCRMYGDEPWYEVSVSPEEDEVHLSFTGPTAVRMQLVKLVQVNDSVACRTRPYWLG